MFVSFKESVVGGAVSTDETYKIGGDEIKCKVMNKIFYDKVYWEGEAFVHERYYY
jgi:hypothetical protein